LCALKKEGRSETAIHPIMRGEGKVLGRLSTAMGKRSGEERTFKEHTSHKKRRDKRCFSDLKKSKKVEKKKVF